MSLHFLIVKSSMSQPCITHTMALGNTYINRMDPSEALAEVLLSLNNVLQLGSKGRHVTLSWVRVFRALYE